MGRKKTDMMKKDERERCSGVWVTDRGIGIKVDDTLSSKETRDLIKQLTDALFEYSPIERYETDRYDHPY